MTAFQENVMTAKQIEYSRKCFAGIKMCSYNYSYKVKDVLLREKNVLYLYGKNANMCISLWNMETFNLLK